MIGTLLDYRYKVIRILATGGFGQTYIAEDTKRPGNPICVVKHLKPTSTDQKIFETAKRLFQSEAETLEKLGSHDQIPRLLAYFDQNQEFFLVQEFIEGHTLSDELVPNEKWSETEVVELLQEILGILQFVHDEGVIHRDIKPDNIIRRAGDGRLVLVDFGAVKHLSAYEFGGTVSGSPTATVAIGTPGYMPTEQGQGKPRKNSDIYALGIIAIQALTGIAPMDLQEDADTGEILWESSVAVNDQLAGILNKMLRYHFKDRYQNATQAIQALRLYAPEIVSTGYYRTSNHQGGKYPSVQSRQKTVAISPANPDIPKPLEAQPLRAVPSTSRGYRGPDILQLLILLGLASGAAALTPVVMNNFQELSGNLSGNFAAGKKILPQYCMAIVEGNSNIRSEPSSINSGNIVKKLKKDIKLEATGKRTRLGWIQLRMESGDLVWAHKKVISNNQEWISCLRDKNIALKTVNDSDLIADRPVPEPRITESAKEKPKSIFGLPIFGSKDKDSEKKEISDASGSEDNSEVKSDKIAEKRKEKVLEKAKEKYDSGDLQGAIALLRSITQSASKIRETAETISKWQKEWQKAETLFRDIDDAVANGNWDKIQEYQKNPGKLPTHDYWRERIDTLLKQAEKKSEKQTENKRKESLENTNSQSSQ
ncbi:MAG: serine/threonine protein kinase [Cyanobacteria bacterium P01_A01_bin.84]